MTRLFDQLCDHYGMEGTHKNKEKGHENGWIESPMAISSARSVTYYCSVVAGIFIVWKNTGTGSRVYTKVSIAAMMAV